MELIEMQPFFPVRVSVGLLQPRAGCAKQASDWPRAANHIAPSHGLQLPEAKWPNGLDSMWPTVQMTGCDTG